MCSRMHGIRILRRCNEFMKYIYSKKANLWCSRVSEDDPYYYTVHNGAWNFRKNGNTIWIEETGATFDVDDWEEIDKDEVHNWRKFSEM